MPNSIFKQFSQSQPNQATNLTDLVNSAGGFRNVLTQFSQFRNAFAGDPRQMVQQLLQSGRMSQADFNTCRQMAQEFMKLMPK